MNLSRKHIILVPIVLLLLLAVNPTILEVIPDQCTIFPVTCKTQDDIDSAFCSSTTLAMILLYCDEQYGTEYFGKPFDQGLFESFADIVRDYKYAYESSVDNLAPYPMRKVDIWSWYRGIPSYSYFDVYDDVEVWNHKHPGENWDESERAEYATLTNIDYNCMKTKFNNMPYYLGVAGNHAVPVIGWCDYQPNPAIVIYTTWYCGTDDIYIYPDIYDVEHYWNPEHIVVFHFDSVLDCTGDMNGDGDLNSADIRFLALHILGATGYENPTSGPDVNSDGTVNSGDIRYLALYILGVSGYEELYP